MKVEEIKLTIAEAKRFIKRAEVLIECRKEKESYTYDGKTFYYDKSCGKESGALRRASLDLTRQLAQMRKP